MLSALVLSFLASLVLYYFYIPRARSAGLLSKDLNKKGHPLVVKYAGPVLLIALLFPMMYETIDSMIIPILLVALMGLVDDLIGLSDLVKTLFPLLVGLLMFPLTSAYPQLILPIGTFNLPLIYPLILVPLGMAAASNLPNLLAGFNGLEASLGIILLAGLHLVIPCTSLYKGPSDLVLFSTIGALAGLYIFNRYPAKIFPGNTITYLIGAEIGVISILNHVEFYAVVMLIPQIIEFLLKARFKFEAENFGEPDDEGRLSYNKPVSSLTHLIMKKLHPTEQELVMILTMIQLLFVGLSLFLVVI